MNTWEKHISYGSCAAVLVCANLARGGESRFFRVKGFNSVSLTGLNMKIGKLSWDGIKPEM